MVEHEAAQRRRPRQLEDDLLAPAQAPGLAQPVVGDLAGGLLEGGGVAIAARSSSSEVKIPEPQWGSSAT